MEEICQIFQQTLVPDNEIIGLATQKLIEIYQNPANIQIIIQIILNIPDIIIKRSALSGLKMMMNNHWTSFFEGNPVGDELKNQLFILFQTFQNDENLSNSIVDCLSPILETQGIQWTEFMAFLNQNLTSSSIKSLSIILKHTTQDKLTPEFLTFCVSIIQKSMSTNNPNLIFSSTDIFIILVRLLPLQFSEVLSQLFSVYFNLFVQNPDFNLAKAIASSFDAKNPFFNASDLLSNLIQLATQSTKNARICYIIIRKLISVFGKNLRIHFNSVIQATMTIVASMFSDDCYDVDHDANYIADVARKCCKRCESNDFVNLLSQFLIIPNNVTPHQLFAILELIHSTISEVGTAISSIYENVLQIISNCINIENHTIQELALICLIDLIEEYPELFEDNAEEMFKAIVNKINCQHHLIMELTIKALSQILLKSEIDSSLLIPIFPSFISAAEQSSGSIKANIILLICGFVFSLADEISPFVSRIAPVIIRGTQDSDCEVQGRAIETLGSIIMFAPQECEPFIQQSMTLFIEALDHEEICCSAFYALIYATKATLPIDPFIEMALLKAIEIAAPNTDNLTSNVLMMMEDSIRFMNTALRIRPNACDRWRPVIGACCLTAIKSEDEDIIRPATMGLLRSLNGDATNPIICEALMANVRSDNKLTAAATFHGISYILKTTQKVDMEFLNQLFQCAIEALNRQLPCQISEKNDEQILANFDEKILNDVFCFLSTFAEKLAPQFPVSDLFGLIVSHNGQVSQYETEFSLSPIVSYVNVVPQNEIYPHILIFVLQLTPNSQTKWPFALIKSIVQHNVDLIIPHLNQILPICENRIEDNKSALSLLCLLSNIPNFPIQNFFQKMLEKAPIKGDINEMLFIWSRILDIMEQNSELFEALIPALSLKCAKLLNYCQDSLPAKFSMRLLQIIKNFIAKNPEIAQQFTRFGYVCQHLQM
ncbi:hypothetical protein TRFO_13822 [Tritrichomonas foetus]|uniref:Dynein axonemal assembly factor 5 TPR repeats domain-containing protein n=1 Tax=Tritrichomonas foetus TaxID=1144522 RepID=A0A1J4L1N6_9EUKA|nr:hypothetical protein TRFO_13822 [Tritrichomonas foetus]|eukprot:OHT15805.1 hypothetical protein TRFO_13822 [Tritrichomonas foetus]